MIEDLIMETDNEGRPPRGPALVVPGANSNLAIIEQAYRSADIPGARDTIFTEEDEETGQERLENAAEWQAIMGWPRLPTLEEAEAFKANASARLEAVIWYAVNGGKPGQT